MPKERTIYRKKQLTYKRNVKIIDTTLNENIYEILPIPSVEKPIIGLLPNVDENAKKKRDKKENHFTNIPQVTGQQNVSDIITNKPGVTQFHGTGTEKDTLDLFFTPGMIKNIVLYTNK